MEIIQTILMIIGAITIIWLICKAINGTFWLLGELLEAGFRNHFPFDFMFGISWIISEMKSRGYHKTDIMDAGGENPKVIMKNPETEIEMEIRLHAPLFTNEESCIFVTNQNNQTAIVMKGTASGENKRLLAMFLEC